MLDNFNIEMSKIISESFNVDPKYIDKEYQGSVNKVDLFTLKSSNNKFSKTFISNNFINLVLKQLNINDIKKETNVIIYIPSHSLVFTRIN